MEEMIDHIVAASVSHAAAGLAAPMDEASAAGDGISGDFDELWAAPMSWGAEDDAALQAYAGMLLTDATFDL